MKRISWLNDSRAGRGFQIAQSVCLALIVVGACIGGGVAAFISTQDLTHYADDAEAQLTAAYGAPVSFVGPVRAKVWPTPHIQLGTATIRNWDRRNTGSQLIVEHLWGEIELEGLFPPRLIVRSLTAETVSVTLPASSTLADSDDPGDRAELLRQGLKEIADALAVGSKRPMVLPYVPVKLKVSPTVLVLTDVSVRTAGRASIEANEVAHFSRASFFLAPDQDDRVAVFGHIGGREISVDGVIEPVTSLFTSAPFRTDAKISGDLGTFQLSGAGALTTPIRFKGKIVGRIKDLSGVMSAHGMDPGMAGPWAFSVDMDGTSKAAKLKGQLFNAGANPLVMDVAVTRHDGLQIVGRLKTGILDLNPLMALLAPGGQDRVFSDTPLPISFLRSARMDLTLTADKTLVGDQQYGSLKSNLWADKGIWVVGPGKLALPYGSAELSTTIDVRADPRVSLMFNANSTAPSEIAGLFDLDDFSDHGGRLDMAIELVGQGFSMGEIAANAQGQTNLLVSVGAITQSTKYDLTNQLMFGLDSPPKIDKIGFAGHGQPSCLISRLDIENGVAHSSVFLLDTQHAVTGASGTIDLATERVAMKFRPRPKNPNLMDAAVDLTVAGPLQQVRVSPAERGRSRGIARSTGQTALLGGVDALMPLLPLDATITNPCVRRTMGETAAINDDQLADLNRLLAAGEGVELGQ